MVTTHNSTALKVSGITEDIFICNPFLVKDFLNPVTRHKRKPIFMPTIFQSPVSHPKGHINPTILTDAK